MPCTRSQKAIDFPRKKSSRVTAKAGNAKEEASLRISPQVKVLPLSPRKRLGDDNLCNVPQHLQGSPPKQSRKENHVHGSPTGRRLVFDENQQGACSPVKKEQAVASAEGKVASPLLRGQETPSNSKGRKQQDKKPACIRLFREEGTCYQQAKQALNTAIPERLLARENETKTMCRFLMEHVCGEKPGSLYISGAPGTGKTACLNRLLQDHKDKLKGCKSIFINCMSLRSSQAIFPVMAEELTGNTEEKRAGKDLMKKLEKQLTSDGPMVLLVLDEMDQLDTRNQDVLYTLFEWPSLPNSRLVLIGIANALDLTDRILPRLQARPKCKPQLLNFPPYTRDQIAAILQDRLKQVSGAQVLDNTAIQFCARKVSAVSGDIRKALDVCRRAVEIVESDVRSQMVLKPLSECKSPAKSPPSLVVAKKVSLPHISRVIQDVYGDRMVSSGAGESFPLQQKLLVCSLLLLLKQAKIKEATLGKLHETYSKVCRKQQVTAVDQSECLSLSSLLEARGILGLKKAKEARLTKVSLKVEERDVEHALKDKVLIGNILSGGLP
ncbi:cell division control protein 6 homolog [Latimeria chalumnae]|uniref:cell division control protein 6 homolog n=1 Tax=Latimeria chalumnae TaxID=7897 RepID=UPI00313F0487